MSYNLKRLIPFFSQGVEDPLLELKTPTLFVIGSHSNLTSQEDVEVSFSLFLTVKKYRCSLERFGPFLISGYENTGTVSEVHHF